MLLSSLINLEIMTKKPKRLYGLLRAAEMKDGRIVRFVINEGSLLSFSESFLPESVASVEEEHLMLGAPQDIIRMKKKELENLLQDTLEVIDLPVADSGGNIFGKVEDVEMTDDYTIVEYIVSRSFFDDIDTGFVILPAADIGFDLRHRRLSYNGDKNDLPADARQSGLLDKIFGIKVKHG